MQKSYKRRYPALWIFTACAVAIGLGGIVVFNSPSVAGANPGDPDQVALGKAIYQENCASCHGAKLEGQPNWRIRKPNGKLPAPPHDKSGHTWHHPDQHLFRITKKGVKPPLAPIGYKSDMPSFESVLSDDQIWAVIAFVKQSWPQRERARQNRINGAYKQ